MRFKISIFNCYSKTKIIRYIVDESRVRELSLALLDEVKQHAFDVVLVEQVKPFKNI